MFSFFQKNSFSSQSSFDNISFQQSHLHIEEQDNRNSLLDQNFSQFPEYFFSTSLFDDQESELLSNTSELNSISQNTSNQMLIKCDENNSEIENSIDNDSKLNTIQLKEKKLSSIPEQLTPQWIPSSIQEFTSDRNSSTIQGGFFNLRSSSDPVIALHSLQARKQQQENDNNIKTATAISLDTGSSLPSFQETYPIKYSQPINLNLKMDEDCYNFASHHPENNNSYFHISSDPIIHQSNIYDLQQQNNYTSIEGFYQYQAPLQMVYLLSEQMKIYN